MRIKVITIMGVAIASLLMASCGTKTQDPVELITSAAAETTVTAEETVSESEAETGADLEKVEVYQAGPGAESEYIYQQIDDDQVHKVTYWTDGETRRTDYFKNLYIPGWGVEKITLPSDLIDGEPYVLKPGEEITAETAKDDQIYDDSVNYGGNFSLRTTYEYFRVWRVNVGRQVDLFSMNPEKIHHMIYDFQDHENFLVNIDEYWEFIDEDGSRGYIIEVVDLGHWKEKVAYKSYILVRVEDGIAHCMMYGDCTDHAKKKWDYIITTAKLTKIRDVSEGEICEVGKY